MYKFAIRGTRGTLPAVGRPFLKHGGHTTCFTLETDEGLLIFDAGTGIVPLGNELHDRAVLPPMTLLFTHFHLDHVMGLPCFRPIYDARAQIVLMAYADSGDHWRKSLNTLISNPFWPMALKEAPGVKSLEDLPPGQECMELYGTRISWCPVCHPQVSLAYKLEGPDSVIVIATDHEHAASDVNVGFLEFCQGADHLIYDATYTPDEYAAHNGWGHGNWEQGVQLAMEVEAGELILTHHEQRRTDQEIQKIVETARRYFPRTRAATENMVLTS